MPIVEKTFPIKQMYDENGAPFYPITHIDLVLGDKTILEQMGSTLKIVDLSEYLVPPFTGVIELRILNNFIFNYIGRISYTDSGIPMEIEKDIIVARDIPKEYRSIMQLIHCSVRSGVNDRVIAYIDTEGMLKMKITPKCIYRDEFFEEEYKSSVTGLDFNAMFVRTAMEDEDYGD